MAFRQAGGVLATGDKRSCLPDALFVLLSGLGHQVKLEEVRVIMPVDGGNTLFIVRLPLSPPRACTHPLTPPTTLSRLIESWFRLRLAFLSRMWPFPARSYVKCRYLKRKVCQVVAVSI